MSADEDELTAQPMLIATTHEEQAFAMVRGALDKLVAELRVISTPRNTLGLGVNVAIRNADAALRKYPLPKPSTAG